MGLPGYAELHCRSNFSFLTGASHPAELIDRARRLGYAALAITDECSLSGVVRAHVAARDRKFHLIVGCEMQLHLPASLEQQTTDAKRPKGFDEPGVKHARLVLLAQTR